MNRTTSSGDGLVHSYLFLRRAIGIVGMTLPIVLIVGNLLWPPDMLLDSISSAYYSPLRGVLVGSLSATGVFLLSYRGYGAVDDVTGDVAGVAAIGAALFPTTPPGVPSRAQDIVGYAHTAFAGVFFLALVFFSLFLFPRTGNWPVTREKRWRNAVYRVTGVLILVAVVLIGVVKFTGAIPSAHPMLWLETVAILAFGVAWAVKGETLGALRDRTPARVVSMRSASVPLR